MAGLFDTTGQGIGTPITSPQDQGYQQAATAGYAASQRPAYNRALQGLRTDFNSRGMGDSGLEAQGQMDLQNQYLNGVGQFRQQAGLRGADVGMENQRLQQARDWQVQDRDKQYQYLQQMMDMQKQQNNQQQLGSIYGGLGQGLGTLGASAAML